jgi:capsular polysaccharide biosynthesis protein
MFSLALKRWWIILIAMVLGAALLFAYTYFLVEPMYTSTARIGIRVVQMNAYNESLTGQKVAKDCSAILLSDVTLDVVADKLNQTSGPAKSSGPNPTYSNAKLRGMITTTIDEDTRFFDVSVSSNDPQEAKRVCDAVINAFCSVLKETNYINEAEGIILNYPNMPTSPSSPNKTTNTVIGAIIGLVISLACLLVEGFVNDTIDGEDWIIGAYGDKIPMLAVIPDANSNAAAYKKYTKKYGYGYGHGYAPHEEK